MTEKKDQETLQRMAELSEGVLRILGIIAIQARYALGHGSSEADELLRFDARQFHQRILDANRDGVRLLTREPAVARLEVRCSETGEHATLYFCRASTAGFDVGDPGLDLVSIHSKLGRLAELLPGRTMKVELPIGSKTFTVNSKVLLHPAFDGQLWDSLDTDFLHVGSTFYIESLRRFIDTVRQVREADDSGGFLAELLSAQAAEELLHASRRNKRIESISLRDQPVLDEFQGAVFRMPLSARLILLGPPGTGKTTTLIHRLSHKRTLDGLEEKEVQLLDKYELREKFLGERGWIMYSPTDLLKLYVRDAFNKEGIPAADWNLRTWDTERLSLAKDVFRVLKGGGGGRFLLSEGNESLLDDGSPALSALHDEFTEFLESAFKTKITRAVEGLKTAKGETAAEVSAAFASQFRLHGTLTELIHTFAQDDEFFKPRIAAAASTVDKLQRKIAGGLLSPNPQQRLRELAGRLQSRPDEPAARGGPRVSGSLLESPGANARLAKALLEYIERLASDTLRGTHAHSDSGYLAFLDWIGDVSTYREDLGELGHTLHLRERLEALHGAARSLVFDVPQVYVDFKRQCFENGRWYTSNSSPRLATHLDPAEIDILLLVMLRHFRRTRERSPHLSWLRPLTARVVCQVFVDEATDFSAVQLACMLELTDSRIKSWFASGDFRQRMTRVGIRDESELEWIENVTFASPIEQRVISHNFRQSPKLRRLASTLLGECPVNDVDEAEPQQLDAPEPLLVEHVSGAKLTEWLSARIVEIEIEIGRLPSIAIFVVGDDRIESLVAELAPKLREHNIRIVGCYEGRVVGDEQEVRVFDIRHVKGLEFEGVFFVDIDILEGRLPELFERVLYVGVTRAATFLGLTCERSLPESIGFLRPCLDTGTWISG